MSKQSVSIRDALTDLSTRLAKHSDSPRLDAELIVCRAIDADRTFLYSHPDDELDTASLSRIQDTLARRLDGEPMAYITGQREFWSISLAVSPAVLIPRPETEVLVDLALREVSIDDTARVLDLGTGSGAIAIAIASERPAAQITATDISTEALDVARINARELGLSNIEFVRGNWIEPVRGRQFDLIVSNPPYVCAADPHLDALKHEPLNALQSGSDGLDACRILASESSPLLRDGGAILVEHGADQAEAVAELLRLSGWSDIENHRDYAGLPRVTAARRRS